MKKFLAGLFGITPDDLTESVDELEKTVTKLEQVEEETENTGETEPGFIDVSGHLNDDGQIELKVDWDDDFIKKLKAHGYNGANDEVIVQQYLATLHRELMFDANQGEDFE